MSVIIKGLVLILASIYANTFTIYILQMKKLRFTDIRWLVQIPTANSDKSRIETSQDFLITKTKFLTHQGRGGSIKGPQKNRQWRMFFILFLICIFVQIVSSSQLQFSPDCLNLKTNYAHEFLFPFSETSVIPFSKCE